MNTIKLTEPFDGSRKKRVSIYEGATFADNENENMISNPDGSVTRVRSRSLYADNGLKRTEINSETFGGIIKVDTDVKLNKFDTKYNSEEVSVVKKGGKEIIQEGPFQEESLQKEPFQ